MSVLDLGRMRSNDGRRVYDVNKYMYSIYKHQERAESESLQSAVDRTRVNMG